MQWEKLGLTPSPYTIIIQYANRMVVFLSIMTRLDRLTLILSGMQRAESLSEHEKAKKSRNFPKFSEESLAFLKKIWYTFCAVGAGRTHCCVGSPCYLTVCSGILHE